LQAEQGYNNPLFRAIRQEGVRRELPLIVATIQAFSEGRVRILDGQVVDSSGNPVQGYALTPEIEEIVRGGFRE
jgi:phosphoribosylglycinamide formyltransferase-1